MNIHAPQSGRQTKLRSWFRRSFVTGIIVLVPILGTLFLFSWGFNRITNWGLNLLFKWDYFFSLYGRHKLFYDIIGRLIVILGMALLLVLVGFLTRNLIGRRLVRLTERFLENIPMLKNVFVALKQISKAFIDSNRPMFSYVVLFEYPRRGIYSLGFVMSESFPEAEMKIHKEIVNVFLMTTPNPTTGFFMTIPKEDTIRLSMSVEDGVKMVISGGAVVPEFKAKELAGKNSPSSIVQNSGKENKKIEI